MIFKPDMLAGEYSACSAELSRDLVRGVLHFYDPSRVADYEASTSAGAVAWGTANVRRKIREREWYTGELVGAESHVSRLESLIRGVPIGSGGPVGTAELVLRIAWALGFEVNHRERRVCTYRDFLGLYAHNTHFLRLAGDLREYLSGQPMEVLGLSGEQHLSALHIMKEFARRILRYPDDHYDALQNMFHVADPGSPDWEYFTAERR